MCVGACVKCGGVVCVYMPKHRGREREEMRRGPNHRERERRRPQPKWEGRGR